MGPMVGYRAATVRARRRPAIGAPVVQVVLGESLELVATLWAALDTDHRAAYDVGDAWFRRATTALGPDAHALGRLGAGSLQFWDHVLSLALDGPADAGAFMAGLSNRDPVELRARLLGGRSRAVVRHLPPGTVEAAAAGNPDAADRLRRSAIRDRPEWQGAIRQLLADDPAATRDELVRLLHAWRAGAFAVWHAAAAPHLAGQVAAARSMMAEADDPIAVAEGLLGDTPLAHEASARSVVLAPSLIVRPFTYVLDETDRLAFIYPAALPPGGDGVELNGRVLAVARALGDEMRLQLVARLRNREATLRQLMGDTGWPRSTLRHHLTQLVEAGIVTRSGAAGGTRYRLRETALPDLADLMRRFLEGG